MKKLTSVQCIVVVSLLLRAACSYGMDQGLRTSSNQQPEESQAVVVSKQEDSALYTSIATGNPQEVQALIAGGQTCKVIGVNGETPLHWVLDETLDIKTESRIAMLDMLMKAGADLNTPNDAGRTPVHEALLSTLSDAPRLFQFLYDRSITGDLIDIEGQTPLHGAVSRGLVDVVQHILAGQKTNLEARDFKGLTPLQLAFKAHLPAPIKSVIIHELLQAGANTEVESKKHIPLLFKVIKHVDVAGVELLLNHGANVHAMTPRGKSVLEFAQEKVQKSESPQKAQCIVTLVQEYREGKRVPRAKMVPADHYSHTYITIPIPANLQGQIDPRKFKANLAAFLMRPLDGGKTILQLALEKSFIEEQKEHHE